jgi:type IV secretion system protein VirD4
MTRPVLALPAGLIVGAFIGLMLGGAWLNLQSGQVVHGDPFVLITGFPGLERAQIGPWRAGYTIAAIATVMMMLAALLFCLQHRLTQYGNAHFQTRPEIRKNGLLEPAGHGLVFAKTGSPRSRAKFVAARYDRFPHCLVCAPTRAGKGVGYVIPNTLLFPGSCVILDVKGEIFAHSSRHRQGQGDAIYYFAPLDFEHGSHRYNPLERLAELTDTDQRFTELSKLASYFLTVSDKGGAGDFIVGARQLFVAAGMLAIERGRPSIGEITRILFDGADKSATYEAHAEEVRHPQSRIVFTNFSGYSDRTLSSYGSVLSGAGLGLWLNPKIDRVTSANDFSFRTLRSKPQSIYIIVESDDMVTLAPLLRLVFGELIATLRASLPDPQTEPWPVQIVLDEFDQLGHMPIIVQSLKQLAGHGARVSIITQSIPGLDRIYGEDDRLAIESGAGMKLFLSPNDKKTASEVSEALGKTTRLSVSDSYSQDGKGILRRSVSRRNEERPLLTPDEVRKLSPAKVLLIPERQNPILMDRIVYYEDRFFRRIHAEQSGTLPYPGEAAAMRSELTALKSEVAELRAATLEYGPVRKADVVRRDVAIAANAVGSALINEVADTAPILSDAEMKEVLRPTEQDALDRMARFAAKLEKKRAG